MLISPAYTLIIFIACRPEEPVLKHIITIDDRLNICKNIKIEQLKYTYDRYYHLNRFKLTIVFRSDAANDVDHLHT